MTQSLSSAKARSLGILGLFGMATAQIALSATAEAQSEEVPVNSVGEEIFGQAYVPQLATEATEPLIAAQPSVGVQLDPTSPFFSADNKAFMAETEAAARLLKQKGAPLLERVRRARGLPSWREKPAPAIRPEAAFMADSPPAEMRVHFVDVGQGAGAILELPCHTAVIDTGGEYGGGQQRVDGGKLFEEYLDRFFKARPTRKRTIDLLITSHPHEDHLAGLARIMQRTDDPYIVKNVVDNGQTHDKGKVAAQKAFRTWAIAQGAKYGFVNVTAMSTFTGVTNGILDPIGECGGVDPKISMLWGSYNEKVRPGTEWENPNNHSLVVRVDFGAASFLFVGDLEDTGSNEMLKEFKRNPIVFDVGVYHVSHHGAGDDTTERLMKWMSPEYAILSMGRPEATGPGSASQHGHPRLKAINELQMAPEIVSRTRPQILQNVATAQYKFKKMPIFKALYGTGWGGTIVMRADTAGTYEILPAP